VKSGGDAMFKYAKEEGVYAYHGPLIYEATILDTTLRVAPDGTSKVYLYQLHYNGWNSYWDEWVPQSRVMKHTNEAQQLQKERVKEFNRAHKKRARAEVDKGAGKKAKAGDRVPDDTLADEIRESLRLPQAMKLKMIEDWERITREKRLVPLPSQTSISTILEDFLQAKAKRSSHERVYGEVTDGIKTYFNQALGTILLYKFERKQYRDTREENKALAPIDLYGAEHLLRLFVKLPDLLAYCKLQREHLTVLVAKLTELLKFVQTNKAKYFVTQYEQPSEEYLRWWGNE